VKIVLFHYLCAENDDMILINFLINNNMKKLIFAAIISLIALTGMEAQSYKWWAGGRTSLWSGDDYSQFSIAPEVGYHLSPKLTIAASLGYHYQKIDRVYGSSETSGAVLNPYIRYTAFKTGILLGFVDTGFELGIKDYEGFQVGFKPGIALLLTDRFTAATQFGFIGYNDGKRIGRGMQGVGFDLSGYCSTIAFFYSF
jgi:hypothetical protein